MDKIDIWFGRSGWKSIGFNEDGQNDRGELNQSLISTILFTDICEIIIKNMYEKDEGFITFA